MSCHGVSGAHSAIAEEDCSWSELSTGQRKQDGTIVADPSTYHDTRFQIGRQQHLTDDWLIGGALGYDNWHGTTDALGATSGQDFSAGLVAKHLGRQLAQRRGADRLLRQSRAPSVCLPFRRR